MFKKLALVASLLFIFTGVFLLYRPLGSLLGLTWLFALNLFGLGLAELVAYLRSDKTGRSIWELIHALVSLGFGIFFLCGPLVQRLFIVPTILAYWLVVIGLCRIFAGLSLKHHFDTGHYLVWLGGFSLALGLVLLGHPLFSALFLAYLVAFTMIYKGIECFIVFIRLVRLS
ncbi:HdeD family acid-resistance protein [Streptococcus cuniculipharyngis]|uniref:DUF308 domain-containing protein n=1 Tax=Streptococcus cuniculipharyngis TaxID=1562651 RepID=A0A5C5SFZ2_9STRE|nr:DUF308 domain-containing protein [Streptococcus cuniculipharyngis]TWS99053.1 hypothetical protein FRX57_02290 [Streptococcus cuniculipharyngis]